LSPLWLNSSNPTPLLPNPSRAEPSQNETEADAPRAVL